MLFLFYFFIVIVAYTYILYPLFLFIFKPKNKPVNSCTKKISVIIPAYNEINIIEEKILNTIAVTENIWVQIILVTNGSNDGTELFEHPAITHLHSNVRKGKAEAINTALRIADGEILVFTDANTILNAGALDKLLAHFEEQKIGAVCGEKSFNRKHKAVALENMYWKFESRLKEMEAACYSVMGAAGELFAIRSELLAKIPENLILDDFYISMEVCRKGYLIGYEKEAKATEKPSLSLADEYQRRVRISSGVMQWLLEYGRKNFWKYKAILKWQFFSHRFCRWILAPIAFLGIIVTGCILGSTQPVYLLPVFLYFLLAFTGFIMLQAKLYYPVFYIPFYFLFVHICFVIGYCTYFINKHSVLWHKAKRN